MTTQHRHFDRPFGALREQLTDAAADLRRLRRRAGRHPRRPGRRRRPGAGRAAGDLPGLPPLAGLRAGHGAPAAAQAAQGDLPGAVRGPPAAAGRAAQLPAAGGACRRSPRSWTASPPSGGRSASSRPITEASAEYQAIAYALETPGVELVLVDRSTDHVFQWSPRRTRPPSRPATGCRPAPTTARRRRCTATPSGWRSVTCGPGSPSWRRTCCTTARCGTGRSGGTSTSSSRWPTPTTTPTGRSWC